MNVPFLYDIMVGSMKIWFSNGYCCITKVLLPCQDFLRLGTAGWYCVAWGKILFFVLFYSRRAGVLSEILLESVLSIMFCGL